MTCDEVLNEQPVLEQLHEQRVLLEDARAVEAALLGHGPADDLESLHEVARPEVVESGLGGRLGHQRVRLEAQLGPGLLHEVEDGPDLVAVTGLGEVVDADRRRTAVHTEPTGTTATSRGSGVRSGKNQRNQMRPRAWPAVETQFWWDGRRGDTTMVHEPSAS